MENVLKIDSELLDNLSSLAKKSDRLRQNYDLRTNPEVASQRMLNALEPGTIIPIHRHQNTTEVIVMIRGSIRQDTYRDDGSLWESFVISAEQGPYGFSIPAGVWHSVECLEENTVYIECKDGKYTPLEKCDIMELDG